MATLRIEVWSDYLCPWCYNASVRLRRLRSELGGALAVDWRAYLLRPRPALRGDRDEQRRRFVRYTESWLRPAAEPDSGTFRVWQTAAGPPSHSVPAHRVAKAARRLGEGAFDAIHERLLHAYFAENRDVSDRATLEAIWGEAGLPAQAFAGADAPELLRETLEDHAAAAEQGVTGVPAARIAGGDAVLLGALPLEVYRRWIERNLR